MLYPNSYCLSETGLLGPDLGSLVTKVGRLRTVAAWVEPPYSVSPRVESKSEIYSYWTGLGGI